MRRDYQVVKKNKRSLNIKDLDCFYQFLINQLNCFGLKEDLIAPDYLPSASQCCVYNELRKREIGKKHQEIISQSMDLGYEDESNKWFKNLQGLLKIFESETGNLYGIRKKSLFTKKFKNYLETIESLLKKVGLTYVIKPKI